MTPALRATFDLAYPEIDRIISKRRGSWTYLSIMEWADVKQHLLVRTFKKWHKYDPAYPLENWLNTLASNEMRNLRRDLLLRTARPCIGGGKTNGKACTYNQGGDSCSLPACGGTQCAKCPVYAKWQQERQFQHHIKNQVSLENHTQEVYSKPDEHLDIEAIREWLHKQMLKELSQWERKVYQLTIIKEISPAEAAEKLARDVSKRKRPLRPDEQYTYSAILVYNRTFRGMMKQLLFREGYIGEEHMAPKRNRSI